jgi:hypothetical protein
LRYNYFFIGLNFKSKAATIMEAEKLNQIANRLNDLSERNHALRGYL